MNFRKIVSKYPFLWFLAFVVILFAIVALVPMSPFLVVAFIVNKHYDLKKYKHRKNKNYDYLIKKLESHGN